MEKKNRQMVRGMGQAKRRYKNSARREGDQVCVDCVSGRARAHGTTKLYLYIPAGAAVYSTNLEGLDTD